MRPQEPSSRPPLSRRLAGVAAGGLTALLAACGGPPVPGPADWVLRGGRVMTLADDLATAEAVAVAAGRIVYVGSDRGVQPWIGEATQVVELVGRMVLPAFQDAHVHPLWGGVELGECNLNEMPDAEAVLARVADCAGADPEAAWLRGGGFQLPQFGGNPTAAMLDAVEAERPVYLTSADGHSAWVNSAALRLAGITAETPDPPLGRIERHPRTGEPSGTLREAAMQLVAKHLPPHTHEERLAGLRRALDLAARFGITVLHEATAERPEVAAYAALRERGELTARVSIALYVDPSRGTEQVRDLVALREEFDGGRLRVNTAKLYADGVIEGQTAALLEPYLGRGDFRGELNFEPAALAELVTALDAEGFQVHVHAIGDRAIRVTLDAFEQARQTHGERDSRHGIAHAQLIDPGDIPRFRELGVIANFQPLWAYADPYITELTEPFLGPERSRWLYPIGSLVASGAPVAFGSDWSVSSMNPLEGIEVGVTRADPGGPLAAPWIPEESVALETMLAGYIRGAARFNFLEGETGSIELGKAADLVVLDRDLTALPPHEIGDARVLLTLLAGEALYRDDDLGRPASAVN